jgi:predicted nucleotidyltransferase
MIELIAAGRRGPGLNQEDTAVRRDDILAALRAHESELRAAGVTSLSLFGSAARGDGQETSDVDVLVRLEPDPARNGFAYFGFFEQLANRLEAIVHRRVDVIAEPVLKPGLRREVEKDRVVAF